MYSYSNLANALLLMAAINLDSLNDEDFLNKIQSSLSKYCQCFSGDATTYYEPMTNKDFTAIRIYPQGRCVDGT